MRPERAPIYLAPQLRAISRQLAALVPDLVRDDATGQRVGMPGLAETTRAIVYLDEAADAITSYNATIREYNQRYQWLERGGPS